MKTLIRNFFKLKLLSVLLIGVTLTAFISCSGSSSSDDTVVYTVTFETNGGSAVSTQRVKSGAKAIRPQDPVKSDDSLFMGWYLDSAYQYPFDFDSIILENKKLYARWGDAWVVTFSGADNIPVQKVKNYARATRPETPADKDDLTFDDWYADSAFKTKFDFSTPITDNTTIYANWLKTFKVDFDSNGGSEVASVRVLQNAKLTKPANPTRGNRTFAGWYTDSGCTKAFEFSKTTITRDMTLFAKWAVPSDIEQPLSIQITKAGLDVEYTETTLALGKRVDFTSSSGEGDWYVDGKKSETGNTFSVYVDPYAGYSKICTVEFHKKTNGIEYTWTALITL